MIQILVDLTDSILVRFLAAVGFVVVIAVLQAEIRFRLALRKWNWANRDNYEILPNGKVRPRRKNESTQ